MSHDCFIFPSMFKGGGIVLYEAAGRGSGLFIRMRVEMASSATGM